MQKVKKLFSISILGRTNAGKSTLFNSLVNKKLAAVTSTVNTTRTPVTALWSLNDYQFLLLDGPGVCQIKSNLDQVLFNNALAIAHSSSLIWWVIDVQDEWQKDNQILTKLLQDFQKPIFLLINKIDLVDSNFVLKKIAFFQSKFPFTEIIPLSAWKQTNFFNLKKAVLQHCPLVLKKIKSNLTFLNHYSEIAKEIIREQIILQTRAEIPHQTVLAVDEFKTKANVVLFQITIFVAANSQKGIILGKNGNKIKQIRLNSQKILMKLWKKAVLLFLKVKVHKNWYQDLHFLKNLKLPWKESFNV